MGFIFATPDVTDLRGSTFYDLLRLSPSPSPTQDNVGSVGSQWGQQSDSLSLSPASLKILSHITTTALPIAHPGQCWFRWEPVGSIKRLSESLSFVGPDAMSYNAHLPPPPPPSPP